ncbi:DUF6655 family protein [Novipirellula artificiosorum]|uniref:Uncharacterized protein n=1 Tax=Novipirellula artificiosorum TaxID=2528016 RepID=A0A5C6DXQ9_9BACT|nr:DUF6655 family protein [Novipirellula artificiosorum]TWU41024.1 hypothetical protein Poly41_18590 [Novipirellula artificiosorum]
MKAIWVTYLIGFFSMVSKHKRGGHRQWLVMVVVGSASILSSGCATTTTSNTSRTGTEQLLISAAIDRAFSNVHFTDLAGYRVFIDQQYLDSVDKGYLVGTLRHKVLESGGQIVAAIDKADVVLEPRSGGIGTDSQESFVGIPSLGVPGLPIEIPEIKIASRATQMGTAKIGLLCYDAKTGMTLGGGGDATALTHNNDTYVLGVGPFRSGSVLDQRETAVGYNGVGGSFLSMGKSVATARPIKMIDRKIPEAPFTPATQIAELPSLESSTR